MQFLSEFVSEISHRHSLYIGNLTSPIVRLQDQACHQNADDDADDLRLADKYTLRRNADPLTQ